MGLSQKLPLFSVMTENTIMNSCWTQGIHGIETNFSLTRPASRCVALVAINQASGIGSVFDATETGVQCLLGLRGGGYEEALARALLQSLKVSRVILTVALSKVDTQCVKSIMKEVEVHSAVVR